MTGSSDSRLLSFYLSAMRDLGRALQSQKRGLSSARPLRESLYRLLGTFAIGRGALLVTDEQATRLELAASKGLRSPAGLELGLERGHLRKLARVTRPFRANLPPGGLEPLAAQLRPALERASLGWIVPLTTGQTFVGLVLLGDRIGRQALSRSELEVLEEMAGLLALRIDDARVRRRLADQVRQLEETQNQLRQIFMETVRTLAGAIDGEPEGRGASHSVRVASLAAEMARRLGLPDADRERLYLAGLLHDIGKQVIHQDILGKPEALSEEERRMVERHPAAASELIGHIQFPWGDVAEIIRHHHERPDGGGYPDRLAGEQISIEARILMMAEAFDAMTTDQPWRPRLALPKIAEQIGRNLGIQFEPRIVQALCDAVEAGLDAAADPPEFVSHLEAAFDPALIRRMLREVRRQLGAPPAGGPARVIEAIVRPRARAGESGESGADGRAQSR